MLEWLPTLAADPVGVSVVRKDRAGVPGYVAEVPGTSAFVDYIVVEQFRTILIHNVVDVRDGTATVY